MPAMPCDLARFYPLNPLTPRVPMGPFLKEHAWKTSPASTKKHRNTSLRNRFNDLPLCDAPPCDLLNAGIRRRFRDHFTQFLHSSHLHVLQYVATFLRTLRYAVERAAQM
jgi:hypothetical protein